VRGHGVAGLAARGVSMALFSIPPIYRPGFAALLALSADQARSLAAALQGAPATFSTSELEQVIAPAVPSISPSQLHAILETLLSLYALRAQLDAPLEEFAEDICETIEQGGANGLHLPPERRSGFKSDLGELLSVTNLKLGAKSVDVWYEQDHIFHDARILTDVRPVFGGEPDDVPAAAMIVHTLRISYHHGDVLEDFFFAMSRDDLDALAAIVERAQVKTEAITKMLERAGVAQLNLM
jgi:hypothetical protein